MILTHGSEYVLVDLLLRTLRKLKSQRYAAQFPHTMFGSARVIDTRDEEGLPIRVLEVGGGWQSACYRGDGWGELVFGYHRIYRYVTSLLSPPRHVLMLGGGAYSWPIWLLTHLGDCRVDVVEVDPQITKIARDYFGLDLLDERCGGPDAGGRLRSLAMDARKFLEKEGSGRYDLICNDCFSGQEPVMSLLGPDAARRVHRLLEDQGGCYLSNVVSALEGPESALLREVCGNLGEVFSHVYVLPCGADEPYDQDNNVVVATDSPLELPGSYPLFDK